MGLRKLRHTIADRYIYGVFSYIFENVIILMAI